MKDASELEDWKAEVNAAVNKAAKDIRDAMGASYATRFLRTETWIGDYASGNVNRDHGGCRRNLDMHINNLRAIFDALGN